MAECHCGHPRIVVDSGDVFTHNAMCFHLLVMSISGDGYMSGAEANCVEATAGVIFPLLQGSSGVGCLSVPHLADV